MKILITLVLGTFVLLFLLALFSKPPKSLGVTDGKFAQCPDAKNCVSSQATNEAHAIAPIKASGEIDVVMEKLAEAIKSMEGSRVVRVDGPYLWAEFTSTVFRFVDDVECYYDQQAELIHIRSASRVGYYDFNANRKRVEELRRSFLTQQ